MSLKDETPDTGRDAEGFKKPLRRGGNGFIVTTSKQSAVAMTSQVYTKTHNRNKNPALVSLKHCELLPLFTAGLQNSKHEIVLCGIEAIRMGFEKFPDRKIPKVAGLNRITTPSEVTHFRQPTVTQWPHLGKGTGVACRLHITSERGLNMPLKRKQPCNS